ncbi:MAG: ATP-binding protein [Thermoguttaceae bacterium]
MAHRPLYRVLGETSLELKCLSLFGAFLLLVISASFLSYWYVTGRVVTKQNPVTGYLLADASMLQTHWRGLQGLDPWGSDDSDQTNEGRRREQDQYRVMVERLRMNAIKKKDYEWKFISPDSRTNGAQPEDQYEKEVLAKFLKHKPSPPTGVEKSKPSQAVGGEQDVEWDEHPSPPAGRYLYYQAVRAEKECATFCHHDTAVLPGSEPAIPSLFGRARPDGGNWAEGDLMAVLRVEFSNELVQKEVKWYWNTLLGVAIITAFLAMIAFYLTIRYLIIRPLRHLREVSDSISRGNIAQRANLRTGDEFESLSVAFNRMLLHLVTVQDELREVNSDLDGKVDELAQVNMQLYEMNRIKSDFLATMSHELRTPLNSILGFSDVLGSIQSLDDKQKRYVQNIQKSGKMLLEMINNILDIAKIESGKMEVRLSEFPIEQVIAAQCDMARPLSEKKNIDLLAEIESGLPPMCQDQSRVQQILNNLLSNAIKFTPEGGRVRVTAQRNGREELLLRVIDTGVGIAEEDQQVIFEKFRQGRTALPGGDAMTREYSGTGLGLSIVKELCRLLEGEVTVESELGTGSTFTVRLPWKLQKQPRLESPLSAGFEHLGKPRLDPAATEA